MMTRMMDQRIVAWGRLQCLLLVAPFLAACGGDYYQVTDTSSGKSYFTRDVDYKHGHVEFTDGANGDDVILDGAQIREVTPQQYRNAVRK